MPKPLLKAIQLHNWHENVRELREAIERAALLSPEGPMNIEGLSPENEKMQQLMTLAPSQIPEIGEGFSLEGYLSDIRRKLILRALELSEGNQSEASRMLKITPQAVHQFLKFHRKASEGR